MSSSFLPFATGLFSRKRKNPSRGVTAPAPAAGPSSVLPSTLDAPRAQASRDSSQTSTNTTHSTSTASTKSFLPFGNPEAHYKPRKAPSLDAGLHSHHHRGAPRKRESAALQQQRPLSPSASVPPTFLHVPASPFQQASPAVSIASTRSYPTQSSGWSDTQDLFQWERQAALGRAPSRRDASRSSSESGPATGSLPSAHEVILVPLPSPAPRYPSSTKLSSSYDEDSDEAPLDALEVLEIFYEDAVPLPAWMEQALMEPLASPPPSPWPGARGPLPALPPPTPSTPTTPTTPRVSGRTRGGSISAVRSPTPSTIRASIIPPSPRQSTTNPTNRFSLRPKGVTFEDSSSAHGHTRHQSVQLQERPTDVLPIHLRPLPPIPPETPKAHPASLHIALPHPHSPQDDRLPLTPSSMFSTDTVRVRLRAKRMSSEPALGAREGARAGASRAEDDDEAGDGAETPRAQSRPTSIVAYIMPPEERARIVTRRRSSVSSQSSSGSYSYSQFADAPTPPPLPSRNRSPIPPMPVSPFQVARSLPAAPRSTTPALRHRTSPSTTLPPHLRSASTNLELL